MLKAIKDWAVSRLKEGSTYAGGGLLATVAAAAHLNPASLQSIGAVIALLLGGGLVAHKQG